MLKRRAGERIRALRQQPTSPLNGRAPAALVEKDAGPEAELDQIYRDVDGKPINHEAVEKYEDKLYVDLSDKGFNSPWHLKGPADAQRVEKTFEDMLGFAQRELKHLPERMEDAILHFRQKFSRAGIEGQYEAELNRVAARGTPWLPAYTHHVAKDEFRNRQATYYLASSENADSDARRIAESGSPQPDVVSARLTPFISKGRSRGCPCYPVRNSTANGTLYRLSGRRRIRRPGVRHTELDLEKYVDLLPYTSAEMEHRSQAVRTFIAAVGAGVRASCSEKSPAGALEWSSSSSGEQRRVRCPLAGRFRTAIQTLAEPGSALVDRARSRGGHEIHPADQAGGSRQNLLRDRRDERRHGPDRQHRMVLRRGQRAGGDAARARRPGGSRRAGGGVQPRRVGRRHLRNRRASLPAREGAGAAGRRG